ncbi:MAG: ABC transporter ATP-binding protein [Muricomes sp.]
MLEVRNLSVYTSKSKMLLGDINFTFRQGVCAGITGPSGSGKTTLLKVILGVLSENVVVKQGEILLDGNDLLKMDAKERRNLCGTRFGFIPQSPMAAFNPYVSVGSQMSETFRKRLGLGKSSAKQLSMEMLKKVNLSDTDRVYNARSSQLSGGMLQRITMAILLGLEPSYIFADEPTSALDERNRQEFLIAQLMELKVKSSILFVSHDDDAIKQLCDEILILQNGKVVEQGRSDTIFSSPQNSWTRDFVTVSNEQREEVWMWNKSQ